MISVDYRLNCSIDGCKNYIDLSAPAKFYAKAVAVERKGWSKSNYGTMTCPLHAKKLMERMRI